MGTTPSPTGSSQLAVQLFIMGIYSDPYKGPLLTAGPTECESSDGHKSYCLQVEYTVSVAQNTGQDPQSYTNSVLDREITPIEDILSLLYTYPITLFWYRAYLDGSEVRYQSPPAPVEDMFDFAVGTHEMRTSRQPFSYWEGLTTDYWEMVDLLYTEHQKKSDADRVKLQLPLQWFHKGADERSRIDRLMAFWVSFNALYGPYKTNSERVAITEFLDALLAKDATFAQRYVTGKSTAGYLQELSQFGVTLQAARGPLTVSQDLQTLLAANPLDYGNVLKTAALVIYGIRSNLFHGDYSIDDPQARREIRAAESALKLMLRELLAIELLGYALPKMGFTNLRKTGM